MRSVILIFCLLIQISCGTEKKSPKLESEDFSKYFKEPQISFSPKNYVCYKSEQLITIDGIINETVWQRAPWTENFVDIEGILKPKPKYLTRVKMLWDRHFFYIAAELTEPDLWATLKKRDSVIFYDNDFELFIDPDGDTHRYYELEINSYGTEWDLFLDKPYRDGGKAMNYWDIDSLLSSIYLDGTLNNPRDRDNFWYLEIAIPWVVLKEYAGTDAPPKNGDQWRVNFSRVQWQLEVINGKYQKLKDRKTEKNLPENNWVWSPQGLINMHYPEMWGFVQFSEKTAGSTKVAFEYRTEEDIKWALRQVYYRERTFFAKYGKFTGELADLGLNNNYRFSPEIDFTRNLFEAFLTNETGEYSWHICQDGRVWKSEQ